VLEFVIEKQELLKNLGLPILKIGNMDLYINATCIIQESFIKSWGDRNYCNNLGYSRCGIGLIC